MPYFLDIASRSVDPLTPMLIETFSQRFDLMRFLFVKNRTTKMMKWIREKSLGTTGFRADGTLHAASKAETEPAEIGFKNFGTAIPPIDYTNADQVLFDGSTELAFQTAKALKRVKFNFARDFLKSNWEYVGATLDPLAFLGIYALIDVMDKGISPSTEGEINLKWRGAANANGLGIGTDVGVIVEELERFFDAFLQKPDVVLCPKEMLTKLVALSRATTTTGPLSGAFVRTPATYTVNGRTYTSWYMTYDGVPFIPLDYDSTKNRILSFNEKWGNSSVTSSLTGFVSGPDDLCLGQKGDMKLIDISSTAAALQIMYDWVMAPVPQEDYCIVRMRGILNS